MTMDKNKVGMRREGATEGCFRQGGQVAFEQE
jgi:hypothetical protein